MKFKSVIFWLSVVFLIGRLTMIPFAQAQDDYFSWGNYQEQDLSQDALNAGKETMILFGALRDGQVDVLRQLMDEKLLEKYRTSFDDPNYPDLLRKIYGGSKIIVKHMIKPTEDRFEMDVQVISPRGDTSYIRLELKRRGLNFPQYSSYPFVVDGLIHLLN